MYSISSSVMVTSVFWISLLIMFFDPAPRTVPDTTFDTDGEGHGCARMAAQYNEERSWVQGWVRRISQPCGQCCCGCPAHTLHWGTPGAARRPRRRWSDHDSRCGYRATDGRGGEYNDDADVNRDGRVASVDALRILQAAVAVYTNLSSSKQCYSSYKLHRKRLNGFHKNNETRHDVYRRCKHISWL